MSDSNGGIGGIYVLSAFTTGTIGVDAQVFRLDVDFDALVDLWRNEDAGKRGMSPFGLIKWRNPDQAMHSDFAGQQTERVIAVHAKGCRFDARFFAGLIVIQDGLKTLPFSPSQVHAQQ